MKKQRYLLHPFPFCWLASILALSSIALSQQVGGVERAVRTVPSSSRWFANATWQYLDVNNATKGRIRTFPWLRQRF